MKKRLFLLFVGFACLYYLVRLAYNMPDIIHNKTGLITLPQGLKEWSAHLGDLVFFFLFTLIPYSILHRFYPGKQIGLAILLILISVPLLFFIRYWIGELSPAFDRFRPGTNRRLAIFFRSNLFYICIYTAFGISFYFIRYLYYKELQQKELVLQNRQSELSFLRSQINPHFLFNSLNNIYSLVYLRSDRSLEAIAGFSSLLRYMLYDTTQDVSLEKEVMYIRKYIELQKLRYEHELNTELETKGNLTSATIPPLLLIPFVENAFKHGEITAGIIIRVSTTGKQIQFFCRNKPSIAEKDNTGGIGLQNVKRRLELLYRDRHTLDIGDTQEFYTVKLEMNHE